MDALQANKRLHMPQPRINNMTELCQQANSILAREEALRVLNVCNACRYCEGLCATFQSLSQKQNIVMQDLNQLANLCHNCTACYHDCQYTPPHDLNINVPATLTNIRHSSYQNYAWPQSFNRLFENNALMVFFITTASLIGILLLGTWAITPDTLFSTHTGPGAFYAVIPHNVMIAVASATFGFSMLALSVGAIKYWQENRSPHQVTIRNLHQAASDIAKLKHLDGGHGQGCSTKDDAPSQQRRIFHQLTMWGFLLCFLSTSVATIYDYLLGLAAPYPIWQLPVVLGIVGGIGLLVGPLGLAYHKIVSDPNALPRSYFGMDYAFLAALFLVSFSGFVLLALRSTSFMGISLLIHLGFVLAFFLTIPYSKFVHSIYRTLALVIFNTQINPKTD